MGRLGDFVSRNFGRAILIAAVVVALAGVALFILQPVSNLHGSPPPPQEAAPSIPQTHVEYHHADRRPASEALNPKDGGDESAASAIAQRGELLAKLPTARVVLDAPRAMTVGDKGQVELRLGVNVPEDELLRSNEPQNQQIPGQAHVSAEVEADLEGPGFSIEPMTPKRQNVAEGFPTVWRWGVQAQDPGKRVLTAAIYALITENGAMTPQQVKSYSQFVNVTVKPRDLFDWLSEIAQDADKLKIIFESLAAIVAVVMGWFGFVKLRGKKPPEKK